MYKERETDMDEEKVPTKSGLDILLAMGITPEDVDRADVELAERRKAAASVNRHVCACGHAMARHTVTHGIVMCKPARMECPCKKARPVLVVQDTRLFIRKTEGGGAEHALIRGIRESLTKEKLVEWLIDPTCDRCGKATDSIVPVPVTQSGTAVSRATGYDVLLCPDCRVEV